MTIINAICDICGKEISQGGIYSDYDGIDRCKKCDLENKFYNAQKEYKNEKEWLKETHIKSLKKLKARIISIKNELNTL